MIIGGALLIVVLIIALFIATRGIDPEITIATSVAQTLQISQLETAAASGAAAPDQDDDAAAAALVITPSITFTSPPNIPQVAVSQDTNCRTGPAAYYSYVTTAISGVFMEVVGVHADGNDYVIVKNPNGAGNCWLWLRYADKTDFSAYNLTSYTAPPTPTPINTPTPTYTPTPTVTPTDTVVPPAAGDLHIIDIFLKTNFEVAVRVGTDPLGSLNGNYQYTVYSNGAQVQQGSCTVPTGSHLCSTGHIVSGTETIQVVIDSANAIAETNEGNNSSTVSCVKATLDCN